MAVRTATTPRGRFRTSRFLLDDSQLVLRTAIIRLLHTLGARDIVAAGRSGVLAPRSGPHRPEPTMDRHEHQPPGNHRFTERRPHGADVFIGVSAPGLLTGTDIAEMADRAIVFACPIPTQR